MTRPLLENLVTCLHAAPLLLTLYGWVQTHLQLHLHYTEHGCQVIFHHGAVTLVGQDGEGNQGDDAYGREST